MDSSTPSDEGQPPAFTDAAGCGGWLAGLPLTNGEKLQAALAEQLGRLNRHPVDAVARLEILELLQEHVLFAQDECARRFSGRPLPLAEPEQAALEASRVLWDAVSSGYGLCLQACLDGEAGVVPSAGLAARRSLEALAGELFDDYRSGHEPDPSLWQHLHAIRLAAEWLGLHETEVAAAYVLPLLLHAAGPFQMTQRQLQTVRRWLQDWSGQVAIMPAAPPDTPVPPLAVNLVSDKPAAREPDSAGKVRWLDLSELVHLIHTSIVALRDGQSPTALMLGEELSATTCQALLRYLYEHYTRGGAARAESRQAAGAPIRLVVGPAAIHHQLSGKPFRPPDRELVYDSWWRRQDYALFGEQVSQSDTEPQHPRTVDLTEAWYRLNESQGGLCLMRPLAQMGARVATGSLIATRDDDEDDFRLGILRWVMANGEGDLHAGAQLFAGRPRPVAVRPTGLGQANESDKPGFLLPDVAKSLQPACLVIPASYSRQGRIVEVFDEDVRSVRLTRLLHRGIDFEVVAYEDQ